MRITVQQLRYFLKTIETGSVSKAAQALGVSQSTLSEALSQVEDLVGFTIINRSRKGATATPAGAEFLEYARRVVGNMDALEERFVGATPKPNRFVVSSVSLGASGRACFHAPSRSRPGEPYARSRTSDREARGRRRPRTDGAFASAALRDDEPLAPPREEGKRKQGRACRLSDVLRRSIHAHRNHEVARAL